jgi:ribosome maturation factor RimP
MNNNIFEIFAGEYVKILLNRSERQTVELNGRLKTVENPMTITGFMIDECDEFYYLGLQPNQLSKCVSKRHVVIVEMSDPDEEQINFINGIIETPEDPNSVN